VEYALQMHSVEHGKLHTLSSKTSSPMGSSSDRPGDMESREEDVAVSATSLPRGRDGGVEVSATSMSRGTGSGGGRESVHSSVSSATQFLRSRVKELATLREKFRFSSRHAGGRDGQNLHRQQR